MNDRDHASHSASRNRSCPAGPYEIYGDRCGCRVIGRRSIASDQEGPIHPFRKALGEILRETRLEVGLTLRQLEMATQGRFKPSAVGGYERGERDISAVRLVELADALQTRPDALVAAAMRRLQPDAYRSVSVNLDRLAALPGQTPVLVGGLAQRLKLQRGDPFTDVVTIRAGDLAIIASEARCSPDEVIAGIQGAVVTAPSRPRPPA